MTICPTASQKTACDLPAANDGHPSTVAYCQQCATVAFRCAAGHWNRPFANFCTQCGQKLKKPAAWEMAYANPQRTATLPAGEPSDARLSDKSGFFSGAVEMPTIETAEGLPGLLAVDGLIVVPNPEAPSLDAYTIAKHPEQPYLSRQWRIPFNAPLTHGCTPIYHGLHLYYVVAGGVHKTSVLNGKSEPVEINGVDAAQIEPLPECAPLKCNIAGRQTMIAGLEQGLLLLDLGSRDGDYLRNDFFNAENEPMSPTLCGAHVVFTSKQGHIFALDIGMGVFKSVTKSYPALSFSAPTSLGGSVYFEALNASGKRSLARYEPQTAQLSQVATLDEVSNLAPHLKLFVHPPLTDGQRLFLSNRSGQARYTYLSDVEGDTVFSAERKLSMGLFVPHRSIAVDNRIYSAHSSGLTIQKLEPTYAVSHQSLAMGQPENPVPVAPPIRYADKLFILCEDRLVCLPLGD